MIQRTDYKGLQANEFNKLPGVDAKTSAPLEPPKNKDKNPILNIYEESLRITSPTYGEDIKGLMKKENIEESLLNANIIGAMNQSGVDVSKTNLNIVVNRLQDDHLISLFEKGYQIEELTLGIISEEIINKETLQEKDKEPVDQVENTEGLEKHKDKLEDIKEDSHIAISNLLRHKEEPTINNLYIAKHKGTPKKLDAPPTVEEIIRVLSMNGMQINQDNIKAAMSLVSTNLEVTNENVKSFIAIEETIEAIDVNDWVEKAAREIKQGNNPGELNISHEEIKQIVEDLSNIDEKIIEDTYTKNKPINLENLQQTLHENVEKILKGHEEPLDQDQPGEDVDVAEKVTTTKRELEEIRLRLTLEAALKLNNKLDIKTTELTKLVEELKVMEDENNQQILSNMGTPTTEENLDAMRQVSDRVYNISHNKGLATAQVIQGEADFTLEGMDEAIKVKIMQAVYDETGTRPERRFGEGIAKVEEQIEHILDLNKIEATTSNIKAAKALIQNNIDISSETIEEAKIVLLKIETVLHELRPATVAQILKEGIRPDTLPIDSLIQHIREMQKESQIDPRQKIAEGILELDKTNQLNTKEREGLVAVYRMLSTITKNETAAIGFLLDNNKEPTLGNLFEASKYIKQIGSKTGKMDVTIDDNLGISEDKPLANIRSLIGEATSLAPVGENPDQWLNTQNIIKQWLDRMTPEELKNYIDIDRSLEDLELKDGELSPFEMERTSKQAKALERLSPQTLSFLKDHQISLTVPNLYWADKMIKNPYLLGEMLEDYENVTGEKISTSIGKDTGTDGDKQNIEGILNELEAELEEQSPKWLLATQNTQAYSMGKELEQMLNTQKQISDNEGMYQIPVQLHHGMSNLNVYVMEDKNQSNKVEKDELKAYMSIKTQNLGVIQVNMRISDKAVAFEMIGETSEVTLGLQKGSHELKAAIEEIGYKVMHSKFTQGKTKTSLIDKPKASAELLKYKFEESKFEHII